jgi:ABC-type sugar transport system ATPase subunit
LKDNQEVILGIRPRDFHSSNDKDNFKVQINIHEYTGAENIIYGQIGQNDVNIAFSRKEKFIRLDGLHVTYEVDKTHIFCANTQKVIK